MKFWQKIFLSTLIVFEIFFVPGSIYLINSSFRLNLDTDIQSGISEQQRFCSSLESNLYLLKVKEASDPEVVGIDKQSIDSMINTYLGNLSEQDIFLEVMDENNKVVYSNLKVSPAASRDELNISSGKVNYIIRDMGEKTCLFVTGKISLDNNCYKVSYAKDISGIYNNKNSLLSLLLRLNILISAVLVSVTIILSIYIVKPISKLIKSTRLIAGGNFSERVKVRSNDEIGLLSENFNSMAAVVEEKIHQLERASEDKQRFIDNLAHELRTPLTSIIGYADYLRTNKYDEETFINSLSFIYDEGKRLEKLAIKLMDMIVLRKEDFQLKKGSLKEIFTDIKNSFIPKLKVKNIELEILTENFSILMDRDLMKILISNLADNAVKASGSGDKIILNSYRNNESNIIVEVKDTGMGISEDDLPRVFEPFFMSDKSRSRANGGAGLGLSLCAEIAKIHDAEIKIKSKPGEGTTVKLIFKQLI